MASGYIADDIYVVTLPAEPGVSKELQGVNEKVSERCDFDVIVNFRSVEVLTSPSLANLITLHSLVRGSGHQLVLCNMGLTTKSIFLATGLDGLFHFADDRTAAVEACRSGVCEHAEAWHI
jgi:anti-anti-sigma regulatory factor